MMQRYGVAILSSHLEYSDGDLWFFVVMVNQSDHELLLHFSSEQKFDFALVTPGGDEYWRWSTGQHFSQNKSMVTVPAGGFHILDVELDTLPLPDSDTPDYITLHGELLSTSMPFTGQLRIALVT